MCGISGFFLREGQAQLATVRAMCDTIRHRGPDDEGFHIDGSCAIGMRRLSIIDLSTGHQPISNEDGTIWVVFNGEIYNYRELRKQLLASGHRLSTTSDTEALVHLYEQEGTNFLTRLRGMYAFAIWDSRRRRLFLARDRFGKKPLYYTTLGGGLHFGSELKCLRAAGVPLEPDREALRLYFQFGYIPDPHSAFRDVHKLPPGGWLTCDAEGRIEQGVYWKPPVASVDGEPGIDRKAAEERLREVFDESVRCRMIADVPLGAFLSGGIDSSSIVAAMAMASPEPVKTFSIGFEEARYNELRYAKAVAEKYKTDHHEIVVRPNSVELIERLSYHFDEPFADPASIPTYIVSEFASRYVKVALTGDGGDELFAGYDRFLTARKMAALLRVPHVASRLISWIAAKLPYGVYGKNYLRMIGRESAMARYLEANFAPYGMRERLLQPEWMLPAEEGYLLRTFADYLLPEGSDVLSSAMYFENTVNLPGQMLVKVDRMSMAASLEVRCPLLDHELAEVAASIPHSWRVRNGKGKQFLLDVLSDRLPPEIFNRPKMGFDVPLPDWFRGPLREMVRDHLLGRTFLDRGIVSEPFLSALLDEHDANRRDNSQWIYALLMLELWFRQYS